MVRASRVRTLLAAVLAVTAGTGCDTSIGDRPAIARPLDYATVHVDLPGCAVPLPPVHDVPRCSPDEIGTRIDPREVCRLLVGLKDRVEHGRMTHDAIGPSDWRFVRSSCVARGAVVRSSRDVQVHPLGEQPTILTVYVDVPERSRVLFAQLAEQSGTIDYFISPR